MSKLKLPSKVWSVAEIAAYAGVSDRHIWTQIDRGNLVAHKIGQRILIYENDLQAWLFARPYKTAPKVQGRGSKPRASRTIATDAAAA